jgi:hypothetical protein
MPIKRFYKLFTSNVWLVSAGVLLAYSLLTVIMTWPVTARLNTHLIGTGDDSWVHYWNNWWVKRVLQQGGDVFYTPLLFHPTGVSLLHHNFAWVNIALWLLLEPFVGGIAAYNLVHLLHIPLCGAAMFLLARRLARSHTIAFVCGLIYAFWPYRMLDVNHPNLISTEVFPLFMLALLRLFQDGRPVRDGVIAGVLLALIGYMRWQLAILAGFLALLYILYTLVWERGRWGWRTAAGLALVGGVAVALVAPAIYPLVRADLTGGFSDEVYAIKLGSIEQDLLTWLVPQHQHPLSVLYDSVFQKYASIPARDRYSAFLGHIVGGLAVVGVVKRWKESRFWLILAVACFILALGPHLQFNGTRYVAIRLPLQFIDWLLPIKMLRAPHRFNALLALPVAILAGYGAAVLREWLAGRKWSRLFACPVAFGLLLGGLISIDYLSVPTATISAQVPEFYAGLAEEPGDFAIVNLPGQRFRAEYHMFYQTTHGRPLQTGHVSRLPSGALDFIASTPLLSTSYEEGGLNTKPPAISRQLALLAEAGFRYIVVDKRLAEPEQVDEWRSYLVVSPRYEDERVVVYSTTPVVGRDFSLKRELGVGVGLVEADLSVEGVRPGDKLEIDAVWGTTAPPDADLQVEVALVNEEGEVGQAQRFDLSPSWPTGEWPASAIVRDRYALTVDTWLDGGTYGVVLNLLHDGLPVGQSARIGEVAMQSPVRSFTVPAMSHEVGATFGDDLRLLGYDLEIEADALRIMLHWQALRRMDASYTMFVHLFDPATGEIVGQADVMPYGFTYPTAWWEAGEVVSDEVVVPLAGVSGGTYSLAVGVYNADTGERLKIAGQPAGLVVEEDRLILPDEVVR